MALKDQGTHEVTEGAGEPTKPGVIRPELDALDFPKDGLSRQWLEFLNQLGAAK